MTKSELESEVFGLLKQWCDGLLFNQLDMPGRPEFDGAILCPACHVIHGRCHDAVYPLMTMADRTGDDKYLISAKKLFNWSRNLLCDDGSIYNDGQSSWNGITVFNTTALHDALFYHGHLLDDKTKAEWEDRLQIMSEWLFTHLRPGMQTNINYFAANACAMALIGHYFGREDYLDLARRLQRYCLNCISENGLLYGEGKPIDALTSKGCRAVDVGGYNVEESLPSLYRCSEELNDKEALETVRQSFRSHIEWMLPDGAWDNSVGTRNFKWTYWGSRTSDGCQEALFGLGKDDPVFAEAALRNMRLYERCTHDSIYGTGQHGGLLSGGPDYHRHREKACVHHAFCHAKTLAGTLNTGLYDFERCDLPSDKESGFKYYPELDTWKVSCGPWRADVTAYDFDYMTGGHPSGGAVSLLWHKELGPVIASGAVDYSLHEAHNQQLSLIKKEHRSLCPRIEIADRRLAQHYDFNAVMRRYDAVIHVDACLSDEHNRRIGEEGKCQLEYSADDESFSIKGSAADAIKNKTEYVLPVICASAVVDVTKGTLEETKPVFNLNPGFMGTEYRIKFDDDGLFELKIRKRSTK